MDTNLTEVPKDQQAAFLGQNGSLIAEGYTYTLKIKYYRYGDGYYKVSYYDDKAVAIVKLSEDEMSMILSCSDVDFGEW